MNEEGTPPVFPEIVQRNSTYYPTIYPLSVLSLFWYLFEDYVRPSRPSATQQAISAAGCCSQCASYNSKGLRFLQNYFVHWVIETAFILVVMWKLPLAFVGFSLFVILSLMNEHKLWASLFINLLTFLNRDVSRANSEVKIR